MDAQTEASESSQSDERSKSREETSLGKMKIFPNQVGGTYPILFHKGKIYKPTRQLEIEFYQEVHETFPELVPWMPVFIGAQRFEPSDFTKIADSTPESTKPKHDIERFKKQQLNMPDCVTKDPSREFSSGWATFLFDTKKAQMKRELTERGMSQFVILTDITQKFKKPCVLDIKLGLRHYPQFVDRVKFMRQMKKTYNSTTRHLGMRIGGMQLWDGTTNRYESLNKFYAKKMTCNDLVDALLRFLTFTHGVKGKGKGLRKDLVQRVWEKLVELRDVMSLPCSYRFFSSSLLIVYEGYRSQSYTSGTTTPPAGHQKETESPPPMLLRDGSTSSTESKGKTRHGAVRERRRSEDDRDVSVSEESATGIGAATSRTPQKPESGEAAVTTTPPQQSSAPWKVPLTSPQSEPRRFPQAQSSMELRAAERRKEESHAQQTSDDGDADDDEEKSDVQYQDQTRNVPHSTTKAQEKYRYFDPRRVEVKMIDYSNIHPLKSFLPLKRQEDASRAQRHAEDPNYCSDAEERLWLHDTCDVESLPDHGVLLGLETVTRLFEEMKDTGTLRRRSAQEWSDYARDFACFEEALLPLDEVTKNFT